MRDETFPILDPTHPDGPRRMIPLTDDDLATYHKTGIMPPPSAYVEAASEAVEQLAERSLPKVPTWVADAGKWQSLSRAERRALERHHRRQGKRA
jgi:hypothetical protein